MPSFLLLLIYTKFSNEQIKNVGKITANANGNSKPIRIKLNVEVMAMSINFTYAKYLYLTINSIFLTKKTHLSEWSNNFYEYKLLLVNVLKIVIDIVYLIFLTNKFFI